MGAVGRAGGLPAGRGPAHAPRQPVESLGSRSRPLEREACALALLATSGAWFMPHALNRFVFLKLAAVAAAVMLAATVPARGRLPRIAVALLGASGVLLVCAAIQGASPLAQLLGRPPRYEGAFVLPVYLGSLYAGGRLLGPGRTPETDARLLGWLALAAIAIGVLALVEAAGPRPLSSAVARPGSLLGNASDEGAWAVLALGPLLASTLAQPRALPILGTLGASAALVCSASRGALLGALLMLLTIGLLAPARRRRAALLAVASTLLACSLALPAFRERIAETSPHAARTATGRLLLWRETGDLLLAHPLLGVGPSGYLDAIPRYHTTAYERQVGPEAPPDSPHNWVLQAASAGGPLLALLAVALAIMTLQAGRRATRSATSAAARALSAGMTAALAGYALTLMFHFTSPGTTPLAALYAGSLLAIPNPTQEAYHSARAPRTAAVIAFGCLALILAAGALAEIPLRSGIIALASGRLSGAETDFHLAEDLRPWDSGIPALAAHAYAALAQHGVPAAARPAASWSRLELADLPSSIQALEDSAAAAAAQGKHTRAAQLLTTALQGDPHNPRLLLALTRQRTPLGFSYGRRP
jgi:O-antigen ligase